MEPYYMQQAPLVYNSHSTLKNITDSFVMNGYLWHVCIVNANDDRLVERTGRRTVATTDPEYLVVNLSNALYGDFLMTVFIHELGHCALWSYGLLTFIHERVDPAYWIDIEEFMCNFLADYGFRIFKIAYKNMGYDAWKLIPQQFDKEVSKYAVN